MMVPNSVIRVRKRDGKIVPFDQSRITEAIWKAAQAMGEKDRSVAEKISNKAVKILNETFSAKKVPTIEEIQDCVEKAIVDHGNYSMAKSYILYREQRSKLREAKNMVVDVKDVVDDYLQQDDWRVKENANISYSFSGLLWHGIGTVMSFYALNHVYPKEIGQAHSSGDYHIHDLSMSLSGYCAGWSLRQLLAEGFNGVPGKVESSPAKHLRTAASQMVNFIGVLQNEWAGAQAFSSFDTYLAPFVREDKLDYKGVKQCVQEYVYGMNITSRWGGQCPFSNITLDWTVPEDLRDQPAIVGGKMLDQTYGDYQNEMDMINKAFIEVMTKGDMNGRVFTWPIPTYNVTKDFDWDSENARSLFGMAAKYGLPYFQNFVNSDLKPHDVRSMCCRLQLDLRELRKKTGGLFGSGESTGSIGVVTINLPRIGHLSKNDDEFFERLEQLMYLAKRSLEIKRKVVERNMELGLLPFSKRYLGNLNRHFSTIGLVGMNEALLNFMGSDIATPEGKAFAMKTLDFMRDQIEEIQQETGHIYNLEATPAEGTSYRFARLDKKNYPKMIFAGKKVPYYTNSTHLPVNHTDDPFEALAHQDDLQAKYTGGTVFHTFLGESIDSPEATAQLVKKIAHTFKLPYYTLTPTFSVCPTHGYHSGEHFACPTCGKKCEVYSRVVGYIRPVQEWNEGKQEEYSQRMKYNVKAAMARTVA